MLTGITLASCAVDAQDRYLAALSGVAFLETETGIQVVATSAMESALTRFTFDGMLTEHEVFRLSPGTGLHDLIATETGLTALARWGAAVLVDANSFAQTGAENLMALDGSASSTRGIEGLSLTTLPQGTVQIADTINLPLGDVIALSSLSDGRVIAGSAFDTGIALLDAAGLILDVALAEDGFWHSRVSDIETVQVGTRDFVIVAASGSSSISVFEVDGDELILTDHEWDNATTHFYGVSELATARIGDMTIVAAGGTDAGLSLFELTADGDLVHLRDITDTPETTLADISGLDLIAHGDGALLVASSERDNGLSVFELEFEFAPPKPDIIWHVGSEIWFTNEQRMSGAAAIPEDTIIQEAPAWIAEWAQEDILM